MTMKQITVIGSGKEIPRHLWEMAEALGKGIASSGAVLICGGKGGGMEAVCKGAKEAGGLTVGILPYGREGADSYVDIAIGTECRMRETSST